MNTAFFTYSFHRVYIPSTYPHFDTRQDGCLFLKLTYFTIRVKPCFFTALPPLNHFCNKKEDFPHFQKEGNPSIFIDFWPFSVVFTTQQHHRLNMRRRHAMNMSTNTGQVMEGTCLLNAFFNRFTGNFRQHSQYEESIEFYKIP